MWQNNPMSKLGKRKNPWQIPATRKADHQIESSLNRNNLNTPKL